MQDIPLAADNLKLRRALDSFAGIVGRHAPLITLQVFLAIPPGASERMPVLARDLRQSMAPAPSNTVFRALALLGGTPTTRKTKNPALIVNGRHPQLKTMRTVWLTTEGRKLRRALAATTT